MAIKKISIKLDDITCLDAAEVWVDRDAEEYVVLSGLSKMVSVEVGGDIDSEEQVIVDFANLKKTLKAMIDDEEQGFDHKLLIHADVFERENVYIKLAGNNGCKRDGLRIVKPNGELAFQAKGHKFWRVYDDTLEDNLGAYLTECLQWFYSNDSLTAKVTLHARPAHEFDGTYRATFHYMHGLCKSSSYGCQNIVHGHSSYVQVVNKNGDVDEFASNAIADYLDGSYVFNDAHAKGVVGVEEELLKIGYKSTKRGKWTMFLPYSYGLPIFAEPTIENIVQHVVEVFEDELKEAQAEKVIISEGLTKQAIAYVAH